MAERPKRQKFGGRKKGTPNKVTVEAQVSARQLVDDPIYRANLLQRLQEGKAGAMEPVLWYYAHGKPKEQHEHTIPEGVTIRHVLESV